MKFTLVTTCLNEIGSLPRWRSDLEKQTRQADEIIITDALSTDGTREALKQWAGEDPRLRVISEKCNAARGRNLAIAAASHEHIVSTDMGVRLDPRWFEEIVKPFEEDPAIEVVAGSYAVDKKSITSAAGRAEYLITGDYQPFIQGPNEFVTLRPGVVPGNLSIAYTRKAWESLGRLPEDLTLYADDSVFGRQILESGCKIAFAPKALVFWSRPQKLREFWAETYRYGRGDGEAAIKTPAAFRLYLKGKLPRKAVPLATALRELTRVSLWKALGSSFAKGDIIAGFYIPLLAFGKGYYFAKGYLVGHDHGTIHCQACRSRLKQARI